MSLNRNLEDSLMVKKTGKRQKKQKKSWTKFVRSNPIPDEATIQKILKDAYRLL